MSVYPENPGWRRGSSITSRLAAEDVAARAPRMIDLCLAELESGPKTPEEVTAALHRAGHDALLNSVRARLTQAKRQGRVRDTDERGLAESRRVKATKVRLATPDELALFLAAKAAGAEKGAAHG